MSAAERAARSLQRLRGSNFTQAAAIVGLLVLAGVYIHRTDQLHQEVRYAASVTRREARDMTLDLAMRLRQLRDTPQQFYIPAQSVSGALEAWSQVVQQPI